MFVGLAVQKGVTRSVSRLTTMRTNFRWLRLPPALLFSSDSWGLTRWTWCAWPISLQFRWHSSFWEHWEPFQKCRTQKMHETLFVCVGMCRRRLLGLQEGFLTLVRLSSQTKGHCARRLFEFAQLWVANQQDRGRWPIQWQLRCSRSMAFSNDCNKSAALGSCFQPSIISWHMSTAWDFLHLQDSWYQVTSVTTSLLSSPTLNSQLVQLSYTVNLSPFFCRLEEQEVPNPNFLRKPYPFSLSIWPRVWPGCCEDGLAILWAR